MLRIDFISDSTLTQIVLLLAFAPPRSEWPAEQECRSSPGKATRVQASMLFRGGGKGPLEELIESLSEIKRMISVQVTTDEND